jgi:hypothetical protein
MKKNPKESAKINKRKKFFEAMGFYFPHEGTLRDGMYLSCQCSMCKARRFFKKYEKKAERRKEKIELRKKY